MLFSMKLVALMCLIAVSFAAPTRRGVSCVDTSRKGKCERMDGCDWKGNSRNGKCVAEDVTEEPATQATGDATEEPATQATEATADATEEPAMRTSSCFDVTKKGKCERMDGCDWKGNSRNGKCVAEEVTDEPATQATEATADATEEPAMRTSRCFDVTKKGKCERMDGCDWKGNSRNGKCVAEDVTEEPATQATGDATEEPATQATEATADATEEPAMRTSHCFDVTKKGKCERMDGCYWKGNSRNGKCVAEEVTEEPATQATEATADATEEPVTQATGGATEESATQATEATADATEEPATQATGDATEEPATQATGIATEEPATQATGDATEEPATQATDATVVATNEGSGEADKPLP